MKPCRGCGLTRPLAAFNVNRAKADGRQTRCRRCTRRATSRSYYRNREHYLARQRERQRVRSPAKTHAHKAVARALYNGALVRQPCEVCADPKTDAHHDDYSKPLEVRWLCRGHHRLHHERNGYPDA